MPTPLSETLQNAIISRNLNAISQILPRLSYAYCSSRPHRQTRLIDENYMLALALLIRADTQRFIQQGLDLTRQIIYDGVARPKTDSQPLFATNRLLHGDRADLISLFVTQWLPLHSERSVQKSECERLLEIFGDQAAYKIAMDDTKAALAKLDVAETATPKKGMRKSRPAHVLQIDFRRRRQTPRQGS